MPDLIDLFIIGAIVHFGMLGLYLVRWIESDAADELDRLRGEVDELRVLVTEADRRLSGVLIHRRDR